MLKQRREAVQSVIDTLIPAEVAIDAAIREWGSLVTSIPAARVASGMAAETGHEALEAAAATFALLIQARTMMLQTHHQLAETKTGMGMDAFSFGGLMPKVAAAPRRLEVVMAA